MMMRRQKKPLPKSRPVLANPTRARMAVSLLI
jgi:hypothetical protein